MKRSSKVTWVNHDVTWWAEEEDEEEQEEEEDEEENVTNNSRQEVKRSAYPPQVFFCEKWFWSLSWNKSKCIPTLSLWIPVALEMRAAACRLWAAASSGRETVAPTNRRVAKTPSLTQHQLQQRMRHYVYRSCGRDVGKPVPLKKYKYLMASEWQITSSGN